MDHWSYKDKPFNMSMAWIDMILLATHTTHIELWRKAPTEFRRGDVNLSITNLAERWGWSRNKTRRFLMNLEADGMVNVKRTPERTVITLVKYEDFQGDRTPDETPVETPDETPSIPPVVPPVETPVEPHLNNDINNELYKEEPKKKAPPPPDGGADEYGPAPDGWDDKWEQDFMNEISNNPGATRAEWYDFWKVEDEE